MQSVKAISIHAPCTGSDYVEPSGLAVHTNFNPRSPHGERPAGSPPAMVSASYFNPRSPHGERLARRSYKGFSPDISIHAPRTGSDLPFLSDNKCHHLISIHAPRTGSDVRLLDFVIHICKFQSTLPARGATLVAGYKSGDHIISIHAPRTGSDCKSRSKRLSKRTFQSTLPARGATDPLTNVAISCGSISIHAPRTGSDRNTSHTISTQEHFNPRSPHGERHLQALKVVTDKAFQSTLPARGATGRSAGQLVDCTEISIHAPRTGSD